jgi:tRNA threonylcarbamoyladenosine biosynthesis protein TsaE
VTFRVRTDSAASTSALAAAIAELLQPSDLVVLSGDLGAGKTTFTQGVGRGLGITERITSPTFTIIRSYDGRLRLHHLDVYRLEQLEEVTDLGLSELLDDSSVTLIEWGDRILPGLGQDHLEVRIRLGDADDDRVVELSCPGPRWGARLRALQTAVAAWSEEVDPSC